MNLQWSITEQCQEELHLFIQHYSGATWIFIPSEIARMGKNDINRVSSFLCDNFAGMHLLLACVLYWALPTLMI